MGRRLARLAWARPRLATRAPLGPFLARLARLAREPLGSSDKRLAKILARLARPRSGSSCGRLARLAWARTTWAQGCNGSGMHRRVVSGGGTARLGERVQGNVVAVGETGFVATDQTHTGATLQVEASVAHQAVLENPGLVAAVLEVDVGVVGAPGQFAAQQALQLVGTQLGRGQQNVRGQGKPFAVGGPLVRDHKDRSP